MRIVLGFIPLFVITIFIQFNGFSQYANSCGDQNGKIASLIAQTYQMKYPKVKSELEQIEFSEMCKNEVHLLHLNLAWWNIVSGNENSERWKESYEFHTEAIESNIEELEAVNRTQRDTVLLIYAQLFRARIMLLEKKYINGLESLNACIHMIEKVIESNSMGNQHIKLIVGLYNYYYGHVYDEYYLLRPFLMGYPEGNMELGLKIITECASDQWDFNSTEAHYFLVKIFLESENNPELAMRYSSSLIEQYPSNLIYAFQHYQGLYFAKDLEGFENFKIRTLKGLVAHEGLTIFQKEHFRALFNEFPASLD